MTDRIFIGVPPSKDKGNLLTNVERVSIILCITLITILIVILKGPVSAVIPFALLGTAIVCWSIINQQNMNKRKYIITDDQLKLSPSNFHINESKPLYLKNISEITILHYGSKMADIGYFMEIKFKYGRPLFCMTVKIPDQAILISTATPKTPIFGLRDAYVLSPEDINGFIKEIKSRMKHKVTFREVDV